MASPAPSDSRSNKPGFGRMGLGAVVALALLAGLVLIFVHWLMPPSLPAYAHPSVWEVLIDSRLVVGVIRLVGIVVAIYLVASLFALMRAGRWIVKMGPADTKVVEKDREDLHSRLLAAEREVEELRSVLQQALPLIDQMMSSTGGGTGGGRPEAEGPADRS